jgi:toxin FitB
VNFLLDTNVLSEWVKPLPDAGLITWLAEADEDRLFLSTVTLAELGYGIERLAAGRRRHQLESWLREKLPARFENRVIAIDAAVANAWGKTVARRDTLGRPIGIMDAFIAATAMVHGLALVTRNAADFAPSLTDIVNPWSKH